MMSSTHEIHINLVALIAVLSLISPPYILYIRYITSGVGWQVLFLHPPHLNLLGHSELDLPEGMQQSKTKEILFFPFLMAFPGDNDPKMVR